MFTFNARKDFDAIAHSAGTSIDELLRRAADSAVAEGEAASADIDHDEAVIDNAKLRIKRSQAVLKKATHVLRLVEKYVS